MVIYIVMSWSNLEIMLRIKNIFFILILLILWACIKPYYPQIDSNAKNKYVVSGRITNIEGWQNIEVSLSSPIESPEYIPVSGCQVKVLDDKGNIFTMDEYQPGWYHVWLGKEYLTPGTSYQVRLTTPGGEVLASGFDRMSECPPLDSVYYMVKDVPISKPPFAATVMQFYVDLNAIGNYSQYYKWEAVETWEYNAAHPAEYYYDGDFHQILPPDYKNYTCWASNLVKNIFTISTKNLSQNIYKQCPLHYIDGHSTRLGILYSILVNQYSISEGAYNYWEQMRINSNEQGGLYEKQPLAIKGNLLNETNSDKEVLGYFYAASETERRYFYHDIPGITVDSNYYCAEDSLGRFGWQEYRPDTYPVYYYFNAEGYLRILSYECIDCRELGGTIMKPPYWPKEHKKSLPAIY